MLFCNTKEGEEIPRAFSSLASLAPAASRAGTNLDQKVLELHGGCLVRVDLATHCAEPAARLRVRGRAPCEAVRCARPCAVRRASPGAGAAVICGRCGRDSRSSLGLSQYNFVRSVSKRRPACYFTATTYVFPSWSRRTSAGCAQCGHAARLAGPFVRMKTHISGWLALFFNFFPSDY